MIDSRFSRTLNARPIRPEHMTTKAPAPSGRLRAACDSCHQAKVKCSGEDPCSTCQISNLHCVYSPASRQGRPKGSKNKRTLMQERKAKASETQERRKPSQPQRSEAAARLVPSHSQQHKSMSSNLSLDLEHEFGPLSATDHYLGDSVLLLSPQIDSACLDQSHESYFQNSLSNAFAEHHGTRGQSGSLGDGSVFSAHVHSEFSQPPYDNTSPGTLDITCQESGYATGGTSPFPADLPLFSSRGSASPGHASRQSTSTRSSRLEQCSCLQQQAQLVYRLDDLKQTHDQSTSIDSVLQGVQIAHEPWENLMQCTRCQSQGEQMEVFLLFAMSIRTLLSLLQKSNLSNVGVSVGGFELSGKFKAKVMGQLTRDALQSISSALRYLQEHTRRSRRKAMADQGSNNANWDSSGASLFNSTNMPYSHSQQPPGSSSLSVDDVASLLDILQSTMQSMKQDLRGPG